MIDVFVPKLNGYDKTLVSPPDKSISIRAVIIGSYAVGNTVVRNISLCDDVLSAIECMRALGANITIEGSTANIVGAPFKSGELYCGNSATTARLLIGLLSGLNGKFIIDGDNSLRNRPMRRVVEPLRRMGARIEDTDGKLPITVYGGALSGLKYELPLASAQVKSALMLAALNAADSSEITDKYGTRDHTEIMLERFGCSVERNGNEVCVSPSVPYAREIVVPGDISAAAYPMCIALASGGKCRIKNVGINPTRTGVLDVLRSMGADIEISELKDSEEPSGNLTVSCSRKLSPFKLTAKDISRVIDEIPALCALACFVPGVSEITGAVELRHKETDRLTAIVRALSSLGAKVKETADGLTVYGGAPLVYGVADPEGDHRIAMCAAAAGACGKGAVVLNGDCVSISYPHFFDEVIGV